MMSVHTMMQEMGKRDMTAEPRRVRVTPDLEPILEESTTQPLILEAGQASYRVQAQRLAAQDEHDKVISSDDPLLALIGADQSAGDSDTSLNIHHYLADAFNHRQA